MRCLLPSLLLLTFLACGAPSAAADAGAGAKPDFALLDVNAASPSAGKSVSPRDLRGKVSAWYFGHSS
ncbi:MAG: hypothetical protein IT380_24090 [Myxococcales bacterium]|nr:hypothetical protein [Myxococcales bacterium]